MAIFQQSRAVTQACAVYSPKILMSLCSTTRLSVASSFCTLRSMAESAAQPEDCPNPHAENAFRRMPRPRQFRAMSLNQPSPENDRILHRFVAPPALFQKLQIRDRMLVGRGHFPTCEYRFDPFTVHHNVQRLVPHQSKRLLCKSLTSIQLAGLGDAGKIVESRCAPHIGVGCRD
jgi:hypothetical protein